MQADSAVHDTHREQDSGISKDPNHGSSHKEKRMNATTRTTSVAVLVTLGLALAIAGSVPAMARDDELLPTEPKPAPKAPAQKPKPPAEPKARLEKYLNVQHPRILVTPERLALIREQIKAPGSHFQLAYAEMVKRGQGDPMKLWGGDPRKGYWPVYASRELAFLSLVEGDPKQRRRYAEMAAKVLPNLNYIQSFGFKSKSLGHAMATFGVALTYDWAYPEWTDAERQNCEVLLEYFRKHWESYHRVKEDLDQVSGYNFYGVLFGAQAMMHLAMGGEKTEARFPLCVDILAKHLSDVGGELGAHNEGIGYTEYPMGFALPAALALAQHGETRPLNAAKTHAFWTLNMFVQTFMTSYDRKIVQYGVSHRSNSNEGFASLVLGMCPADVLPHYLWFYDRHMGRLSKAEANMRFDRGRGNTPFALMTYPASVEAKDPTGVLPKAVADRDGYIFFRNRWQDENDIQVGLLNPVRRSGGWSQNEYLNLRLMAFDTRFFGGPGKERGVENYTTLLVDGANGPKRDSRAFVPGRTVAFEPAANGGYAIVDAGKYYEAMGVSKAVRHLLVAFSEPKQGKAILATLDEVGGPAEHRYTWQANLGAEGGELPAADEAEPKAEAKPARTPSANGPAPSAEGLPSIDGGADEIMDMLRTAKAPASAPSPRMKPEDDGIISTHGTEGGRPFFLLKGRKGNVKGWVLHPADAAVRSGDPLQVETKGTDVKVWIAMWVGAGEPPAARIGGSGMDTVLEVDGRKVSFDGKRVRCE